MDASTKTESAKAFSRNLLILTYAIAGKAVLALALALLTSNYAISEIASMAALLIAVAVLTKASAFRLDPAEVENEGDGVTLLRSTTESMRSIAAPLLGFLLCQSTQGIGLGALLTGRESLLLQTPFSFAMVEIGMFLCSACLIAIHSRIRDIVNFYYCAILASLLLLIVPWISADLSGGARVLITALPWGFSMSMLLAIVIVSLLNMQGKTRLAVSACSLGSYVAAIALAIAGFVALGDAVINAIWRSLLIVLIAYVGLDILRQYQAAERRIAETIGRHDEGKFDEYGLTNREKEVLTLLLQGRRATWIAQKLYISDNTARAHVRHIYQKTGVHSREELLDLMGL